MSSGSEYLVNTAVICHSVTGWEVISKLLIASDWFKYWKPYCNPRPIWWFTYWSGVSYDYICVCECMYIIKGCTCTCKFAQKIHQIFQKLSWMYSQNFNRITSYVSVQLVQNTREELKGIRWICVTLLLN